MAQVHLPASLTFQRCAKPLQAGVVRILLLQRRERGIRKIQAIKIALRFHHAAARLFLMRIQRQRHPIALQCLHGLAATRFDRCQCRL